MKVLYLTNLPAPYTVEFLSELGKLCDLTVIYERRSASDRDKNWHSDIKPNYKEIYLSGIEVGTENSFCPSVKKYLRDDFDRIIIGMYSTYTAMIANNYLRRKNIPFIISTDGGFIGNENLFKRKLKIRLISSAEAWLSPGKLTDEYLVHYGARKKDIYRYPFSSLSSSDIVEKPITFLEKQKYREGLGFEKNKLLFIGVGQFIYRKGWDLLVKAINTSKLLQNIQFVIIGGTEQRFIENLKEGVVSAHALIPENVKVLPFMPKEKLYKCYHASDAFVLPTREDIWGLVVNEAMAAGLPVVTSDRCNAGLELIVHGQNGYIYRNEAVTDLKDKLECLVKALLAEDGNISENAEMEMSRNSLSAISEFTYSGMAQKVFQALEEV